MTNNLVKLQLNTPTSITRDLKVELTNQVTGEKRKVKPYLDGSVTVPNVEAGEWRVQVTHPNLVFDVFDRPIRVFPDRPTITPITIPTNLFENVPIRDIPDADLAPVQQHLDDATQVAERQGLKKAGQPIYAEDWNELSQAMATASKATRDLTELVSPRGHKQPEIEEKLEEIQRNLQRMFDAFGSSLAQLQRQIQQLALQTKVGSGLGRIPNLDPAIRDRIERAVGGLQTSWSESPGIYSAIKRRTGQQVLEELSTVLAAQNPEVRNAPEVKELEAFTQALTTEAPVRTYEEEIQQQQRTGNKSASGLVFDALKTRQRG
jgi:hypothetical protein